MSPSQDIHEVLRQGLLKFLRGATPGLWSGRRPVPRRQQEFPATDDGFDGGLENAPPDLAPPQAT